MEHLQAPVVAIILIVIVLVFLKFDFKQFYQK